MAERSADTALDSSGGGHRYHYDRFIQSGVALSLPTALHACTLRGNRHFPAMPEVHWPHAPHHRLSERGTYMVTAGTFQKSHHFAGRQRVEVLHRGLLAVADEFEWRLEAWAVFSNHYHFVGHSPGDSATLSPMLAKLHEKTAKWVNRLDGSAGRKVWHNFWETRLTHEKSYLARLHYVHRNAVRHELTLTATAYPWCSAGWFEKTATSAQVKTIYSFPTDQLKVLDEYEPARDW